MSKVKVLVADDIDTEGIKILPSKEFVTIIKFGISNSEIIKSYSDFDILVIRSIRKIDKNFIDKTSFKIIATCSKGTDHIDTESSEKKGIQILNAEDANNVSAAEHTIGLLLAIEKKILLSDSLVRNGKFEFYNFERNELRGKKIGIVGFGKVGSYLGHLCNAFGMDVYANDTDLEVRSRNKNFIFKSINYILKNCDIITLHIPLNKNNFHFISKDKLKLLNKNSIFINTSRGDIVDEKYLLKMLRNKKIKYACLDVFSNEPIINKGFAALDNVILTNHIAGKTTQSRRKTSETIFSQIKKLKHTIQNA